MAILTVNSGSSSLKLGLYTDAGDALLIGASVSGIGSDTAKLQVTSPSGDVLSQQTSMFNHVHDALDSALQGMLAHKDLPVTAIGHRIVHGGPHLTANQRLTPEVLQTLEQSVHFAPLHIPPALELVRHVETKFPGTPQFACFDTAFHQTMPPEAFTYAVPEVYRTAGVRRYGFHGLSYQSVVHALGNDLPERTVVAHLGSGASACAILRGKSVDTSMGVSPTGGFVMSTRTGDLDPGVGLLLQRPIVPGVQPLSPDALETMVNKKSGLEALAGEGDMQKLLLRQDGAATLAVTIFCRGVAKTIAGYVPVLGGVDLLVFTGGIGEHSSAIRARICEQLAFLGVALDSQLNEADHAREISAKNAKVRVRVLVADENGAIARNVALLNV